MSDRPMGQVGAIDHGKQTESAAAWALKSAPLPLTLQTSAPTAASLKANGTARGSGSNGIWENAKVDKRRPIGVHCLKIRHSVQIVTDNLKLTGGHGLFE